MKTYLNLLLIAICIYAATGGNFRRKKQLGNPGLGGTGVSFAFPGLNLFGGGLGNNNGNIFGGATFTRTIVSTGKFQLLTTTNFPMLKQSNLHAAMNSVKFSLKWISKMSTILDILSHL